MTATENKVTHTPGPWTEDRQFIRDSDGNSVARIDYEQSGYIRANAALIAAAPDLLAACREAYLLLDGGNPRHESLHDTLAAAIARATS